VRDVTETEPEAEVLPARKLGRRTIVIVAVVAVLVLAGIGTGIYFLTRDNGTPAATGPSTPASAAQAPATPSAGATAPSGQSGAPESGAANPVEVGNAKAVAQQAIDAINTHDAESLKKISCDPDNTGPAEETLPDAHVELVSTPELTGDTATVELKLTIGDQSTTTPLPLRKQNGTWCVE
jgi:flagellar basal body-associated protein FliL